MNWLAGMNQMAQRLIELIEKLYLEHAHTHTHTHIIFILTFDKWIHALSKEKDKTSKNSWLWWNIIQLVELLIIYQSNPKKKRPKWSLISAGWRNFQCVIYPTNATPAHLPNSTNLLFLHDRLILLQHLSNKIRIFIWKIRFAWDI